MKQITWVAAVAALLCTSLASVEAEPVKCKRAIVKASAKFARAEHSALQKCVQDRRKAGETPAGTLAACKVDVKVVTKLAAAATALATAIDKACGGKDKRCGADLTDEDLPSSIGWPSACPNLEHGACTNQIFDCNDISACLQCVGQNAVEQIITQDYDTFIDQPAGSAENKCQMAIAKSVKAYFNSKSTALQACWNNALKGTAGYTMPCPAGDASGKTQQKIDKAEELKIKSICKACGGINDKNQDGQCDATGFDPHVITEALSCPDLQAPSGANCGAVGTIDTLQKYIDCVDCLVDFKVDCTDRNAVLGEAPYPGECNPGSTINLSQGLAVGKDLEVGAGGSLGYAAPAGNLQVTITSSDASSVLLSTAAAAAGGASISFTVSAGSSSLPTFFVHGLKSSGTATITATASGYSAGTSTVTLYPSGFVTFSGDFSTTSYSGDTGLGVYAARLDPNTLAYAENQAVRGGLTVDVPVNSADSGVGTIVGSPAVFSGGESSNGSLAFHPVGTGSSVLSLGVPAGFSTPANYQQLTATVTMPHLVLYRDCWWPWGRSFEVGRDLEIPVQVYLDAAPPAPVTVTVTSSDGTVATVIVDGTLAGGTSDSISGVSGSGCTAPFFIQGRALGSTTLTATAAGYADDSVTITVDPSGFVTFNGDFSTTLYSGDTGLGVYAARLDPNTLAYAENQAVRGGLTVDVPVSSADSGVGTIVGSPAVFSGGETSNGSLAFHPVGTGSSLLSLGAPSGFSTSADYQQLTATVTMPHLVLYRDCWWPWGRSFEVGRDLEIPVQVYLDAAPPAPVTVTVTSSDGTVATVIVDGTLAGGTSDSIPGVSGGGCTAPFFIQGRALGSTTLTATAAGYADDSVTVTVDPSGFVTFSGDFSTTSFSGDTGLSVYAARLDPDTLTYAENQAVRGGLTVDVPVNSADSGVGTIVGSPAEFSGGESYNASVAFHPAGTGSSVLSLVAPAGFSTPTNYQQLTATVTKPHIGLAYCPSWYCYSTFAVGRDLEVPVGVYLDAAPPSPITITVTSSDGTVVTVSEDGTLAGGTSDSISGVSTSGWAGSVFAQGRSGGITTLTAHATGYIDGTASVTVDPAGFVTFQGDFSTTTSSGDSPIGIYAVRLDPITLNYAENQSVRGGLTVNVPVISSAESVGTVTGSPAVFNGGDSYNASTAFHPVSEGVTPVGVLTADGFSTPSNYRGFTVTVTP